MSRRTIENAMTNTQLHAKVELDVLVKSSTDPNNRPIIEPFIPELLQLCEKFGKSGQSGGSALFTATALAQAVKKLCLQEPICPITGIDDEWNDVTELNDGQSLYQNKRCSAIFKEGKDGRSYYLNAIIWKGDTIGENGSTGWDTFTWNVEGIKSRQYIKSFPFDPKRFYIDVTREELPEDWDTEPFIEGKDWYDQFEFEATGVKTWHKNKYRYLIKNKKQLARVFKYYDLKSVI